MLISVFVEKMYVPLTGISSRTIKLYGYSVKSFSVFLGRDANLDDLNELDVARYLAYRSQHCSPATVAKDRAQLRALWEFACRRELKSEWPTIRSIRVPLPLPDAWTIEEFSRLLFTVQNERGLIAGIPKRLYWKALLLVCYDTAERIGSVMKVRVADVSSNSILFRAEHRKNKTRDIIRGLGLDTHNTIHAIRFPERELLFPFPYKNINYIYRLFGDILKRAGLPSNRRTKFHKIRRTSASFYEAAAPGSAQKLLDHSNPKTTERYLDPRVTGGFSDPNLIPRVGTISAAEGTA
tara:strand:- start:109 stop:993 length:885 start_codon:yes stop_codon:yes gene_type:complete